MATDQRFWARALFDFNGVEEGDLSFKEGEQILIVNVPDDSEWWEGITTNGARGLLPSNYVERVISRKFSMDLQNESLPDIVNIQVVRMQDDAFELIVTKQGSEQRVNKAKADIETFHEQLIKILPSIDLSKDLPVELENIFLQASSEVTKSIESLQSYFSVVTQLPTLLALFFSWLNPGKRTSLLTNVEHDEQVQNVAETFEEYIVEYDWKPENPNDLELVKGEIIEVFSQTEDGWSYGRKKNGEKGDFPSNYVVKKERLEQKKEEVKQETNANPENRKRPHTIRSLEAFDQLMEKGFVVEILDHSSSNNELRVDNGMRVQIHCCGMIWEGSQHCTNQFVSTYENENELLSFTVGQNEVVSGLDQGVKGLSVHQRARITCTPMRAYGDAGFPPFVPPHSNVVFDIEIISITTASSHLPPAGPQILLKKGISSNRNSTIALYQGRPRSIIFERGDGLNINDDVLAKSYAAMSLNP